MKRIVLVTLFAALAACNKSESASSTTVASASAAPAPPPPFTGTLTGERIMGAKGLVHPFMKWSEAGPKLEGQLGKPTHVKDRTQEWAVKEGDQCYWIKVERQADDTVGMVQDPASATKNTAFGWDDCLTAANVPREGVADDPNAPGPPTDGKPITVAALRDGATKARSKWQNAKLTVNGFYMSTSTSSSGDRKYATVSLTAAKHDLNNTISCNLADPATAPTKLMQYASIAVTGDVSIEDTVTLGGTRGVSVSLDKCAVKASAGK